MSVPLTSNVKLLRKHLGISRKKLARISQLNEKYIQQIEKGIVTSPDITVLRKLATALKTDVNTLFGVYIGDVEVNTLQSYIASFDPDLKES